MNGIRKRNKNSVPRTVVDGWCELFARARRGDMHFPRGDCDSADGGGVAC